MAERSRSRTLLTIGATCVTPILYLVYVNHYAVNSFLFDDYPPIALIHSAIHGHLTLSQLWIQYGEGRQFLSNLIFVVFGLVNRADVRSILFFSAAIFIASYLLVLALFRRYRQAPLTPLDVLIIGVVWFSLGDVGNSLFAYQLTLYLLVFSVLVMLFALTAPNRRALWFTVAVLAAIAASLSFLNGFVAWPLGAICILWGQPWARRVQRELGIWVIALLGTCAFYFHGYRGSQSGCLATQDCSLHNALAHPTSMVRIYLALIGGVIPGGKVIVPVTSKTSLGQYGGPTINSARFELVGAALLAAAIFIIVQSWRHRASRERVPIPLFLICFALFWDAIITVGRTGFGLSLVISINRYVMPNLILLTAVVMYAWANRPPWHSSSASDPRRKWVAWAPILVLAAFIVVQVFASTQFAFSNGREVHDAFDKSARLWVNLDRVPPRERSCEVFLVLNYGLFFLGPPPAAPADHLGEFRPRTYRHYRKLGPPPLSPACIRGAHAAKRKSKSVVAPTAAPNAPAQVFAVPSGDGAARVLWNRPASSESVTGYVVTPYVGPAAQPTRTFSSATTSALVKGLHNGTAYRFTVAAQNAVGTGASSAKTSRITVGVPGTPRVTAVKVAPGSLIVTFLAPGSNGAPIDSYTATCASPNGGVTATRTGNASPLTVTGATAGKTYRCTVKGTNSRGTGQASRRSSLVTAPSP